jgi:two-component system KDP operon response regulator KdpE
VPDDARILVVDDEPAIVRVLSTALKSRGYRVTAAATGGAALEQAALHSPDVVVLDLGLPDIDGIEVCRRLREWSDVPIIVLTAEGAEQRKIAALDEGADDYVTKPFSVPELLARLRVALRHRSRQAAPDQPVFEVGDIRVDLPHHRVTVGAEIVDLTPKEFDFLALLARHAGRVLTHRMILQEVWGPEYGTETQYLRVYASQLRKKLHDDPADPRLVTEPGVGYRLVDRASAADDTETPPQPTSSRLSVAEAATLDLENERGSG